MSPLEKARTGLAIAYQILSGPRDIEAAKRVIWKALKETQATDTQEEKAT